MQEIVSFFKYLAMSNTINFILMIAILAVIVKKMCIKDSLDKSILAVRAAINKSDEAKQNSKKSLQEAKISIEKLPQEVKCIEQEAASKAEVFKNKIEESTQKTIFNIEKNVDRVISIEEKKLSNLLTGKTITASVELAKNHIENLLVQNPDVHQKFIKESIDELKKVKL